MKDVLGNDINEGDLVAAAVQYGQSSGTLAIGYVTKLAPAEGKKFSIVYAARKGKWGRQGTSLFYFPFKIVNLSSIKFQKPEDWRGSADEL